MTRGRPPTKGKGLYKLNDKNPREGARFPMDWALIEKWVMAGATGLQVAAALGIHFQTLYQRCESDHKCTWTEWMFEKREKGNRMIHNKQFEKAMNGSDRMLIWLGKQRLGQTEKIEQTIDQKIETTQKSILEIPDNGNRFIKEDEQISEESTDSNQED